MQGKRRNLAQHMLVSALKHEEDITERLIQQAIQTLERDVHELIQRTANEVVPSLARSQQDGTTTEQVSAVSARLADTEEQLTQRLSAMQLDYKKEVAQLRIRYDEMFKNFEMKLDSFLRRLQEVEAGRGTAPSSSGAAAAAAVGGSHELSSLSQRIDALRQRLDSNVARLERSGHQNEATVSSLNAAVADLDVRINMCENVSHDGTLVWKVTQWQLRREDAKRGKSVSIYSPPFYTSTRGYKCCARLYPNGDGQGHSTHASLFFVLMRNEYDPILTWPFAHKVTFMLINQIPGARHITETFRPDTRSSSFQCPKTEMNVASGCPKFVPLKTLEELDKGFVKNDCIFIQVIVDTSNIRNNF